MILEIELVIVFSPLMTNVLSSGKLCIPKVSFIILLRWLIQQANNRWLSSKFRFNECPVDELFDSVYEYFVWLTYAVRIMQCVFPL